MSALTVYSTSWCGSCKRLKTQLTREGIEFVDIDIETDPAAAALVESVNNGNQAVPTVIFADGTALANPPVAVIKERLAAIAAS